MEKGGKSILVGSSNYLRSKFLQSADSIMALGFSLCCCKDHQNHCNCLLGIVITSYKFNYSIGKRSTQLTMCCSRHVAKHALSAYLH